MRKMKKNTQGFEYFEKSVYICHNINTKTTMRITFDPDHWDSRIFPRVREDEEAKQKAKEEMREKMRKVLEAKRKKEKNENGEK